MSRTFTLGVVFSLSACVIGVGAGCSSEKGRSGFGDQSSSGSNTSGGPGFGGDGGNSPAGCVPGEGKFDIPGNNCDDDNDGKIDNPPTCDDGLAETGDAEEFAKAIGVCATVAKNGYGLVSAEYTRGYKQSGAPPGGQHGILSQFGSTLKPREGGSLGVLSSGYAQEFNGGAGKTFMKDSQEWNTSGSVPPGFPKPAGGCPVDTEVNDVVALKMTLKAPINAKGIKFDFNFFTSEWPAFVCSKFNDGFLAFLSAKGFNNGTPDNISFDKDQNPVSVNNGFFDRCTPGVQTGCLGTKPATSACPGGPGELAGTGYGVEGEYCPFGDTSTAGGATGWLSSQAPVTGGEEFTIEFMIWDTGDMVLDSSVLLDNFTWVEGEVTTATDRPPR